MTQLIDNRFGGIVTATPNNHIAAFDYDVMPERPLTQYHDAPWDLNEKLKKNKSNQSLRSPPQDFMFSLGTSIGAGLMFSYAIPQLNVSDSKYWILSAFVATVCFYAQKGYDAQ